MKNLRDSFTSQMTVREHFAILTLQALLSGGIRLPVNCPPKHAAEMAVRYADALIEELEKPAEET